MTWIGRPLPGSLSPLPYGCRTWQEDLLLIVDTDNETIDCVTAIYYVNAFKSNACAKLMKLNLHILIEENYMFSFYYKKWGEGNLRFFYGATSASFMDFYWCHIRKSLSTKENNTLAFSVDTGTKTSSVLKKTLRMLESTSRQAGSQRGFHYNCFRWLLLNST